MYVAVTAGTLGLGGRADTSPVIEFGEVTRPELNKMTADNLANGYIDLVTPKYKEAYKNLLESDPELPKKIRNHIIKQKNVAPSKVANQLRFDLGKTLNKDGSSNRQWYIDRINKFKEQLAAVSGEKVEKETVERKKLSDFSDEGVEGDIDMPYTIFKVDETAPRLISPIIVALKKILENIMQQLTGLLTLKMKKDILLSIILKMASSLMLKILKSLSRTFVNLFKPWQLALDMIM